MEMDVKMDKALQRLTLVVAVLLGAVACGESPTGVPDRPKVALDNQQQCYYIENHLYCTGAAGIKADSAVHP